MRRLAVAALAAACMSAHAVTPNIFEREPFQGWDWRKPLGELAMTNIVAGTDTWGSEYVAACSGASCSYREAGWVATTSSAEPTTTAFSLTYTPLGAGLRTFKISLYGMEYVVGTAPPIVRGTMSAIDLATGAILATASVAPGSQGFMISLTGLDLRSILVTGAVTLVPGTYYRWGNELVARAGIQTNVEFTQANPIPEPSGALLWGVGLMFAGVHWTKRYMSSRSRVAV